MYWRCVLLCIVNTIWYAYIGVGVGVGVCVCVCVCVCPAARHGDSLASSLGRHMQIRNTMHASVASTPVTCACMQHDTTIAGLFSSLRFTFACLLVVVVVWASYGLLSGSLFTSSTQRFISVCMRRKTGQQRIRARTIREWDKRRKNVRHKTLTLVLIRGRPNLFGLSVCLASQHVWIDKNLTVKTSCSHNYC